MSPFLRAPRTVRNGQGLKALFPRMGGTSVSQETVYLLSPVTGDQLLSPITGDNLIRAS